MIKYRFPSQNVTGVVSHIVAYDVVILSMTPELAGEYYIVEVSEAFPPEEYEHLLVEYGFEEVVE